MNVKLKALSIVFISSFAIAANAQIVYSNNLDPGDFYTGSTTQVVTSYGGPEVVAYRNVQNGGSVGINTNYAHDGNGSAWISGNGTGTKSEIAIGGGFDSAGNTTGVIGSLDSLTAFGADFYTNSSSIANQAPVLRLEIFSSNDGGSARYGQLVFDTAWSGSNPTFNFGQWQTFNLYQNQSLLMHVGNAGGSLAALYGAGERSFATWLGLLDGKGYQVLSVNAGIGSFNGTFDGAIDDMQVGFGGNNKTFNFEAAETPEPASFAVLGLGLLPLLRRRKK